MDTGAPALEVGFEIDVSGSFDSLARLDTALDKATTDALAEVKKVEAAIGGMLNMGKATASVTSFGNAATRELQTAAREIGRVEKAGEAMVRQLERQNAAFGQSREQLRGMKAEAAAVAAEQQGLTELAARIRAQEMELYEREFAAQRQAAQLAEAAAQEKIEASMRAAAAAEAEAEAIRKAAFAHQLFEARVRQGAQALREQEAAEKAAARDAAAAQMQREAGAAKQLADERQRLAGVVRASHAAQEEDAASAERLRASTDPLYAATSRLNAEIAESTRLYYAGVIPQAEYARQQEVLAARLRQTGAVHAANDEIMRRGAGTFTQLSFQLNDVATMAAMGANPMQIFASQAGQIFQIAQMAEGGVKGFASELGGLAVRFAPVIAVAAIAGAAIYRFKEQVEDDAGLKKYVETLGLTQREMKQLGDIGITTGDLLKGFFQAINETPGNGRSLMSYLFTDQDKQVLTNLLDFSLNVFKGIAAAAYGLLVGSYRAGLAIWNQFPAALGDIFAQAVNGAASTIEWLTNKGIDAVNVIARAGNTVTGMDLFGQFERVTLGRMKNTFKGAAATLGKDIYTAFDGAAKEGLNGIDRIIKRTGDFAVQSAQSRYKKKADQIIADRTPKKDTQADQLAREAAAVEAQIAGLYKLADAYGVSGAQALIAEARMKATTAAIKKQGEIEEFVARQVRLAIAQRVSDGAKATAGVIDQAAAQERVNAMVAAGVVPAERAAELVKDQIADLPLLAAIKAAEMVKDAKGAAEATKQLEAQRVARARLTAAERQARFDADMSAGRNRLAELGEELRLVGATDAVRVHQLAVIKASQEAQAKFTDPAQQQQYIDQQVAIADAQQELIDAQRRYNQELTFTADRWDAIAGGVQSAASGMADAFGAVGRAIVDMASTYASYHADRERLDAQHAAAIKEANGNQAEIARANHLFALRSSGMQVRAYGDMAAAAKGFFREGTSGYQALQKAEQVFRAVQFALSVRAMAQDAIETGSSLAKSAARTAANAVEAVTKAISSLPFPLNLAAGAATVAALASIGVAIGGSFGGGGSKPAPSNGGTGTVFGDSTAQSESIKRSLDQLRDVNTTTSIYAREMLGSLRSIDAQIGGFTAQILRAGNVDANAGVDVGFKGNLLGGILAGPLNGIAAKIPVIGGLFSAIGGFINSLFGSTTKITGNGLFGGPQSLGDILGGGFDASYYSDIEKTSKFLGIKTGTSYSTKYSDADPALEQQFTLILRSFSDAIGAAAGPLGLATSEIEARLSGFVVDIGKIDLKGLSGAEIQEKLSAVFGAAADEMAEAAIPGLDRFQKVGEGAFETLVRVASTVEAVTMSLDQMGRSTAGLGIDEKMGIAAQFESLSAMQSAFDGFFSNFYTEAEQAAAQSAQLGRVFESLGLTMPETLAGFRHLVEAQDLTTAAGQAAYATLLQLAPAFADLQAAMNGAKSAADIASERQDLERRLLELEGNTAAIRRLDLAKLDASNRALQEQIWLIEDAQKAVEAARQLQEAWAGVGDTILDEVKRIRGLDGEVGGRGFAAIMGEFNAATAGARAGDMGLAKTLPGLSQELLTAAAEAATSRQELDRIRAQIAASLEGTYGVIAALGGAGGSTTADPVEAAANAAAASSAPAPANDDLASEIAGLRAEVAQLRADNNAGHAATAANTGKAARTLEAVTAPNGGEAITVAAAA